MKKWIDIEFAGLAELFNVGLMRQGNPFPKEILCLRQNFAFLVW
jgi:hypothetical protein